MRITFVLNQQNIGRMFKKHWLYQGKRVPVETGALETLENKNIPVYKIEELLYPKREKIWIDLPKLVPEPLKLDESHPNWHEKVCYSYGDDNLLLEGLDQAKFLTKTIHIKENLPEVFDSNVQINLNHKKIKQILMSSLIYDAYQEKLPKLKDPLRPAWNFPRVLGIPHSRRSNLLVSKIIQYLETNHLNETKNKKFIENAFISLSIEKDNDLMQFQLNVDNLLTTTKSFKPYFNDNTENFELNELHPIKFTISMQKNNIYQIQDCYPVNSTTNYQVPHTMFVFHDETKVKNLYEKSVTESQILSRGLLKAFTLAAAYAKQKYNNERKDLLEPVTVQCVNTDGKFYHFSIFQLNTLDLNGKDGIKNVWYDMPIMHLYDTCEYVEACPTLTKYNPDVLNILYSFLNNS